MQDYELLNWKKKRDGLYMTNPQKTVLALEKKKGFGKLRVHRTSSGGGKLSQITVSYFATHLIR